MGEVYRAVDSNLGRSVAIKVLPDAFAQDEERLARFEREAKTLASLNHPNIAQVFGLEKSRDGKASYALVMELVEGPTLADRIRLGPIPIDEAIPIALQITDALESAHDHGIIHRDLKPANVKVREDGTVKVLDFGLAKAMAPAGEVQSGALANSPTITSPAMTQAGVILGTAAYMSPEQAKGRVVDRRTDIWAFGCVLFEMVTGKRAFVGDDTSDVIVSILRDDPPWQALPRNTQRLRSLMQRCLQKDVRKRLPHIGVARLELSEPATGALEQSGGSRNSWALRVSVLTSLVLALALAAAAFVIWRPRPAASSAPIRVRAELGIEGMVVVSAIAFSPDGNALAFAARPVGEMTTRANLYVRYLDRIEAQALSGTEGALAPFFSPDGRWIAFFADGGLKKISVDGGRVISICEAPAQRGGFWGDDDTIVFASPAGLRRVPAFGGKVEPLTTVAPGAPPPSWPQLLPRGRGVLYGEGSTGDPESGTIFARPLSGGPAREVQQGGRFPRYVASGHLTFIKGGTLFAAPFDLDTLDRRGDPVAIIEGIGDTANGTVPIVASSANGTFAYQPSTGTNARLAPVMWLTRTEALKPLRSTPSSWALPRFSPDGRRLALSVFDGRQFDIWVYDWERDILTRVTADPTNDLGPVWTPDGTGLVFGSNRSGGAAMNLYWQRADGTGAAQRLTDSPVGQLPDTFDREGRLLLFHQGDPATTRQSLMILPLEGDGPRGWKPGTPTTFIGGAFLKANARISPDGKWISYAANDTGPFEVYVQPFPGPGGRVQVSNRGGNLGLWSPTKSELYYSGPNQGRMMAVPYTVVGNTFTPARAQPWSDTTFSPAPPIATYGPGLDIHPDGQRFAVAPSAPPAEATQLGQLVFIFNFFDELRRAAPAR